jgi:hypothetical protein
VLCLIRDTFTFITMCLLKIHIEIVEHFNVNYVKGKSMLFDLEAFVDWHICYIAATKLRHSCSIQGRHRPNYSKIIGIITY